MLSLITKNLSKNNLRKFMYSFQRRNFMQINQNYKGFYINLEMIMNMNKISFNENKG
jgi:hypothetical protein